MAIPHYSVLPGLADLWLLVGDLIALWLFAHSVNGLFKEKKSTLPGPRLAKWTVWWMRLVGFASKKHLSISARRRRVVGLYSGPAVAAPSFLEMLGAFIDRFMAAIETETSKLPERAVNIFPWIKWLTSDVMIQLVFGPQDAPDFLRNETSRNKFQGLITKPFESIDGSFLGLLMFWFPRIFTPLIDLIKLPAEMKTFGMKRLQEELANKEALSNNSRPTHLQHLLYQFKKDGPNTMIPDTTYIASDCMDHLFAGSTTTTDLISAIIWRLSLPENKTYQSAVRQELREAGVVSGRVVKKGQNVEVMGIGIDPGTKISVPIFSLHRDPEIFLQSDVWNPDRWSFPITSPEYKQMMRNFVPFGTGARMCTGMNAAWAETCHLIARIYTAYETRITKIWLDGNGAKLSESRRKRLYPSTAEKPIELLKL
ncbi:hypothetical protein VTO42DRAFT_2143 [Malbranchea cinnamomea]